MKPLLLELEAQHEQILGAAGTVGDALTRRSVREALPRLHTLAELLLAHLELNGWEFSPRLVHASRSTRFKSAQETSRFFQNNFDDLMRALEEFFDRASARLPELHA